MTAAARRHSLSIAASVVALSLGLCQPAFGQSVEAATAQDAMPAEPQAATQSEGGIQDIVVTARKRQESVQDVPVAVTALSADLIVRQDLTSIEKIAARTPSLSVGRSSNGSGAQITMRGIGSSSTSIGIEQSVAVVVDGVYYGQGRTINEGFFDLGGVEILKGPQALFFGKNATAGVISLTSADPTSSPEFKARVGYEFKAQQVQGEFVGSGPLTDTLGIRVAIRASKMFGGYYDNVSDQIVYPTFDVATGVTTNHVSDPAKDGPGERELLARVTLQWEPDDRLTAKLKASGTINDNDNGSWNYATYSCPGGKSQLTGYACGNNFVTHQNGIPADIAKTFPGADSDGDLFNRYRSFAVTGSVNYELDDVTITSVTNYNWNKNRFTCACDFQTSSAATWATENTAFDAFSSELRALTTFDSPVNLMVGALYQKTKRKFRQNIMFANIENSAAADPQNRYLAVVKDSATDGETIAAFGQVTWKIVPTVELAGGVRYTHETKDSYFQQPYANPGVAAIFRPSNDPDGLGFISAAQTFNDWSPEATITWKPLSDVLVYGAYKTAYKSGGFSNGGINSKFSPDPSADLVFEPEKARGFEAGIKTTLADRQLRLNLAAYSFAYNNLQVDFFNSPIFAFQTLTADARTKGIELEFEFAPRSADGLNLHGSINYNRARYTDFANAPCYAGQSVSEGCNLVIGGAARQNLTGAPLAVAPHWTGTLGASYDMPVGNDLMLGLNVDARYSDSYLASGFDNPDSRQGSYVTLDAGIRIGTEDDRWQLALIGKNLTNRFYVTGVVDGPSTGGAAGGTVAAHADQLGFGTLPRTVMVQVSTKF